MMSFGQSVRVCLERWLTFSGRASRAEFWWFTAFSAPVAALGVLAPGLGLVPVEGRIGRLLVAAVCAGIALLAVAWLAAAVRRLHDRNVGGWWLAMVLALGLLDLAINTGGTAGGFGLVLRFATVLGALVLAVQASLPGGAGANAYGPDPMRARPRTIARQPERSGSGLAAPAQSAARSWSRK